jgi:TRAP-type C4-dicarboxylate transport system substrate-binding protein
MFLQTKKARIVLLLIAMLASGSACGKQAEIELRLAHFFPGTHPAETQFVQAWIKQVARVTDGRVKITSFPAETLLKAPDVYGGVVSGVADIGLSCFAYTRGRFPVLEAFELPGITYRNSKAASMTAWEGIKILNPAEVQDTQLLMVIATGPGDIFSKDPITKLEDMKGLAIRATGLSAKTLQLLDAVPNAMPQSETYEALSKGVVKANLSPIEVLQGWKHAEVVKHLTLTPFLYNTLFFVTMNKAKWESLPEDIRTAILAVTDEFIEDNAIGLWDAQNAGALKWAVEEQGVRVHELSAEESSRWIARVLPLQETFAKMIREKKLADRDVMALVRELAAKFNEKYK